MLIIHLLNHEGLPEEQQECRVAHMHEHMRWEENFYSEILQRAVRNKFVERVNGYIKLTESGRITAKEVLAR